MIVLLDTSHDFDGCEAEVGLPVGQLLTPLTRYRNRARAENRPWAIDNGAYSGLRVASFQSLLVREHDQKDGCKFVACPDVVGDHESTLALYRVWRDRQVQQPPEGRRQDASRRGETVADPVRDGGTGCDGQSGRRGRRVHAGRDALADAGCERGQGDGQGGPALPRARRTGVADAENGGRARGGVSEGQGGAGGRAPEPYWTGPILPHFAPGPADPRWGDIVRWFPWIAPAVGLPNTGGDVRVHAGRGEAGGTGEQGARGKPVVASSGGDAGHGPDATQPILRRVADGLPYRVDRLRALGNAVVPRQAEAAFLYLWWAAFGE